ncbi:hypothetical protein TNCV_2277681 [Trichonephila clavipes]|nr:hypothetical protein TNCV_2277681 [Trichonephila clavipes]
MPKIPQIKVKTKIGRTQNHKSNQTSVTAELSYAKVCRNKTEQQMAPRGETPETQNQTPNEKTPENNATPNFLNFATYINELQNLTSKFPEIFQALEDMSKTMILKNLTFFWSLLHDRVTEPAKNKFHKNSQQTAADS